MQTPNLAGLLKVAFAPGIPGSIDYGTYARSSGGNYYQSAHKASRIDPNLNGKNEQALKDGISIGSLAWGGAGAVRALVAAPKLVGAARGLWGAARAAGSSLAKATGEAANGIANSDAVQSVGGTSSTARGISKATDASGRTGVRRGGGVVASAVRNNGDVAGMAGDYAKQLAYKVPYAGAAYKFYNDASTVSGAFGR